MIETIKKSVYRDFGMERGVLIDNVFFESFNSKMSEIMVLARLIGYDIEILQSVVYVERKQKYDYDVHFKFKKNEKVTFMLNYYTHSSVNDIKKPFILNHSSVHYFDATYSNKYKENLIFFKSHFNERFFYHGIDWVSFNNIESNILGLNIFKYILHSFEF